MRARQPEVICELRVLGELAEVVLVRVGLAQPSHLLSRAEDLQKDRVRCKRVEGGGVSRNGNK